MLALLRLIVFGFLFLSFVYLAISFWSRRTRTKKLQREWEERGRPGDQDAYIREGLAEYDHSFRRKLILLVYVVPVVTVAVIIYVTNFM